MARDLVLEVIEQVRGNALAAAARDLDTVADSTGDAAKAARTYQGSLKDLDAQVVASKAKIAALGQEFVATKDKATGKELRGERSLVAQLERIRKEIEEAAPNLIPVGIGSAAGAKAGTGFTSGFLDGIAEIPGKVRGSLMVTVVGAVIATSPLIGGVIAGAVTGAVGLGGIAGGIAAASKDPGVRAAASSFGSAISAEFFAGGQSFVEPTIESLGILRQAFQDMDLGSSWERIAPFVTKVAEGIGNMGRDFMPGFNRALDAAGPGLVILGDKLPEIGAALGNMLGDIAESEGALEGLTFTLDLIVGAINITADTVTFLSDAFHDLVSMTIAVSDVMEDLPLPEIQKLLGMPGWSEFKQHWLDVRDNVESAKFGMQDAEGVGYRWTRILTSQGDAAQLLADAVAELNEEYGDYIDMQLTVDQANQRVSEGLLRLQNTLKENGKDWRDNTEAGQANRAALTAQVDALARQRQATIDAGGSVVDATTKFEAELDALQRLALKAGISQEALNDLVGDYYVRINVSATIAGGDPYSQALRRALAGKEHISGFASGGDPPMGEPFWVGEGGRPELMVLTPRPHVYSAQESKAMAGGGSSSAKTAEALEAMAKVLDELRRRPPPTVNVYATPSQSPQELTAVVARELAWTS